jgi:hypothetical protein
MTTGFRGTFVIAWAQTRIDGVPAAADSDLFDGAIWRWTGRAMPLDGAGAALLLGDNKDQTELRSRAARMVRKILQLEGPSHFQLAAEDADPLFDDAFVVSDGARFFSVVPITLQADLPPLLMFLDEVPPPNKDLTVIQTSDRTRHMLKPEEPSVICFTPGTRLRTEDGDVAIEDLGLGDRVLTRDDGPQEVIWSGQRRMSGARLYAMADQRPIRIRAGALGLDRPDDDLIVSPEHRLMVRGAAAQELFGEPEVLMRAADLVGDRFITVDHSLREVWYVHLMLERHQVVWANNVEAETFHPGYMGLDHLDVGQRESLLELRSDLARDPHRYGAPARRMLSKAEAAILLYAERTPRQYA